MKQRVSLKLALVILVGLLCSAQVWSEDKRIGIIVFDGVLTSDITAPLEVFGVASNKTWFSNFDVITINVGSEAIVTTEEGLSLQVDAYLKDRPAVDVLLMPSSYDMAPLLENKALISYISDTAENAEWMASNCSGAFVLAEAGLLQGKKATTWAGGEAQLKRAYPGVDVQFDTNYVVDDRVITSNGSVVSYEAALILLEKLSSKRKSNEVRDALQIRRLW